MKFVEARPKRSALVVRLVALMTASALAIGLVVGVVVGKATPAPGATWMSILGTGRAEFDSYGTSPIFLLAIGNDERAGVSGRRSDAMHLIGINPAAHQATVINFPRDLGVNIAGHGFGKLNSANTYGLRTTIDTIANLTGVPIGFGAQVNFDQFVGIVDAMGGIDITIATDMNDSFSGAFFKAGPNHLTGDQALRFARNRHDFPNSDISRTFNQGQLLIAALSTLRAKDPGPAGTIRLLGLAAQHVELDGTSIGEVYDLARAALSVDAAAVKNVTIPLGASTRGGNLGVGAGAASLFEDFRDDAILQTH